MSITVAEIYTQVCHVCLEPGGFVLGIFSEAQFLDALGEVMLDFAQKAPLDKSIYTQRLVAGTSVYTVPDDVMGPDLCFVGGVLVEQVTEDELARSDPGWRLTTGRPRQWHEDNLSPKQIQTVPIPAVSGSVITPTYDAFLPAGNNLSIVGPGLPSKTAWLAGDTLDGIPDIFAHYIVYGVLEKIFNSETQLRDTQRALYCHTRMAEGIAISQAIADEELLEGDE